SDHVCPICPRSNTGAPCTTPKAIQRINARELLPRTTKLSLGQSRKTRMLWQWLRRAGARYRPGERDGWCQSDASSNVLQRTATMHIPPPTGAAQQKMVVKLALFFDRYFTTCASPQAHILP